MPSVMTGITAFGSAEVKTLLRAYWAAPPLDPAAQTAARKALEQQIARELKT